MAQVFHRSFNTLSRVSVFGFVLLIGLLGWALSVFVRSSYATNVGMARAQPIPFSHEHHVTGLGIDCRYCHQTAERSPFAGMPSTGVCMNCHQQIWTASPMLAPLRESYRTGESIPWVRVHRLADFAYFDHRAHVNNGIGCSTCHGPVHRMPLTWQHGTLLMDWCLDCHRQPEVHLRPRDQIYNMDWQPGPDQAERGRELAEAYQVRSLMHCSTCHR